MPEYYPFTIKVVIRQRQKGEKHFLRLHRERVVPWARQMIEAWQNRHTDRHSALYGKEPPEVRHRPRSIRYGNREHATFLLACALGSRSGDATGKVFRNFGEMAQTHPGMFDPLQPWKNEYNRLLERALPFGRTDEQRVDHFKTSRSMIADLYGGDPCKIFLNTADLFTGDLMEDRRTLIKAWDQLPGVGSKIAQLAIIWFQDVLWDSHEEYREKWEHVKKVPSMPVDIWWVRKIFQCGLVEEYSSDMREFLEQEVSYGISKICLEEDLYCHDLAQANWINGAENCAKIQAGLVSLRQNIVRCTTCPAHHFCGGRVPFLGNTAFVKKTSGQGKTPAREEDKVFRRSVGSLRIIPRPWLNDIASTQYEAFSSTYVMLLNEKKFQQVAHRFPDRALVFDLHELRQLEGILSEHELPLPQEEPIELDSLVIPVGVVKKETSAPRVSLSDYRKQVEEKYTLQSYQVDEGLFG